MSNSKIVKHFLSGMRVGIAAPLVIIVILAMIVVPLPPQILDVLFVLNIVVSLTALMTCIYAKKPLDFSLFPTILLISTLLRLSLNIASTRVILLSAGSGSAGQVIEAFGSFVMGGNYVVGLVIFTILIIINFIVITKGAERISEVGARFTLDSMPGKQMAVDADLNSGQINQEVAAERRKEIGLESQFHGNMDGASKFVKGDAIAGILILFVNIIGGLIIGIAQNDMSANEALEHFVLLSIGDGLVAILPSIIMALATAIIITRISSDTHLADVAGSQLFADEKVPFVVGLIIAAIGLVPEMPNLLFLSSAAAIFAFSFQLHKKKALATKKQATEEAEQAERENVKQRTAIREMTYAEIEEPKLIQVRLSSSLKSIAKNQERSALSNALRGAMNQLSKNAGILISEVNLQIDLELNPDEYSICIQGIEVARGQMKGRLLLAIPDGSATQPPLEGAMPFTDPICNEPAFLIVEEDQSKAEDLGYEVLTAASVVSTHVEMCVTQNLDKMIDLDGVQQLIDRTSAMKPKLIETAMSGSNSPTVLLRVLRTLLKEQIPVTKISTILEVMAQNSDGVTLFEGLMSQIRKELTPWILSNLVDDPHNINVIVFSQELNEQLASSLHANDNTLILKPELVEQIRSELKKQVSLMSDFDYPAMLLTNPVLRTPLINLFGEVIKDLHYFDVLAIPRTTNITIASTIG